MRSEVFFTAVFLSIPLNVSAQSPEAMATLPLDEVLRLKQEASQRREAPPAPPPVAAAVEEVDLEARLLDSGVDLTARLRVTVLESGRWVSVPLLALGPNTSISKLPQIEGAALAVVDSRLTLITDRAGTHTLEVSLLERARVQGDRRTATLAVGGGTRMSLDVAYDDGLFKLHTPGGVQTPNGTRYWPAGDRFELAWQRIAPRAEEKAKQVRAMPVEPRVERAHAAVVMTLEGRGMVRARYALRFAGTETIGFTLPPGQRLDKVYLNGISAPFTEAQGIVRVAVTPVRSGDEVATVELALRLPETDFHLSGNLAFAFPVSTWPIDEQVTDLYLPEVFGYTWTAGSLVPMPAPPEVTFTNPGPMPGEKHSYHQFLIAEVAPFVRVAYAIDLDGNYFRAR